MSRRKRLSPHDHGALVLDNEGLNRAAIDRTMYIRLKVAHLDGRRVITSAAILAEILRGGSRDAGVHRVLGGVVVEPVTPDIGERAGKLIGAAGLTTDQAVDAMLAATALTQQGPVLIVASDVPHLTALTAAHPKTGVVHVGRLGH
ncbi:type II toxin-antitoxin system VapC family toxin [Streptosporangium sp. NPDC004379]|uniref:type II toxin-antitoxin system VapC family toxin n=1 Tax=Streptosporangium sp. NPDC004379 TaxID=3366189 RepID=UPI0036926E99